MTRKLLMFVLVLFVLVGTVAPALAAPNPNKGLCKGADYVFAVVTQDGRELSQSVYLSWETLYPTRGAIEAFSNQGQCVSHANHGETLYFIPCAHLKGKAIREAAMCYTRAWLSSAAGQ